MEKGDARKTPGGSWLLLPDPLQAHVLSVEGEAARIGDVRRFDGDNDVLAGARDR
jgi:hypothetical protein